MHLFQSFNKNKCFPSCIFVSRLLLVGKLLGIEDWCGYQIFLSFSFIFHNSLAFLCLEFANEIFEMICSSIQESFFVVVLYVYISSESVILEAFSLAYSFCSRRENGANKETHRKNREQRL